MTTAYAQGRTLAPIVLEFVLDETTSMNQRRTIAGFNDFLREQRNAPGDCRMTLTKFHSGRTLTPYMDMDIGMVPDLTINTYVPDECTNLFDAVGERITIRSGLMASWPVAPNVLVVIMTDGQDNRSRTHSASSIRNMVLCNQERGWTFAYLGADQNALAVAETLGIPVGNAKSFASANIETTMSELAAATVAYRATGATTTTFFGA